MSSGRLNGSRVRCQTHRGQIWGNTVETAATAYARHSADHEELPLLTALLAKTMLAELTGAADHLLHVVQKLAAISADVRHLMERCRRWPASPATATCAARCAHVLPVFDGIFERVLIGLPGACASLDDDAAQQMVDSIDNVRRASAC